MSNEQQESIKVAVGMRFREAGDRPFYTVMREENGLFAIAFEGDPFGERGTPLYRPEQIAPDIFVGWAPGYGPQPPEAKIVVEIAWPESDEWRPTHFTWAAINGWDKRERNTATGNIERSSLWRGSKYVVELPPSRALAPTIKALIAQQEANRVRAFGSELSLAGRLEHVEDLLARGFIDQKTAAKLLAVAEPRVTPIEVDPYADGSFVFERGEKHRPAHHGSTPLTALQVIQARKPPEPWRPSVDDWDLLPDAGR